jgi:hypothetical protein
MQRMGRRQPMGDLQRDGLVLRRRRRDAEPERAQTRQSRRWDQAFHHRLHPPRRAIDDI